MSAKWIDQQLYEAEFPLLVYFSSATQIQPHHIRGRISLLFNLPSGNSTEQVNIASFSNLLNSSCGIFHGKSCVLFFCFPDVLQINFVEWSVTRVFWWTTSWNFWALLLDASSVERKLASKLPLKGLCQSKGSHYDVFFSFIWYCVKKEDSFSRIYSNEPFLLFLKH